MRKIQIYAILAGFIFAITVSGKSFSQLTIFQENFESSWTTPNTLSPAWSGTTTPSDNQWHKNSFTGGWTASGGSYSPPGASGTSASARFHSYNAGNNSTGEIITPEIDFSNYSNNKRLVFYLTNASGNDKIDIYLSQNGGESFGQSLGTFVLSGTGYWSLYSVDLGNISDPSVKIKFTATSDFGTSDIGIDEIKIYDGIPLNGIKSIDAFGDYTSFKSAMEDLNRFGVGPGGITFNITANQIFTEDLPVLSVSGTQSNPVIFQRSGTGNNPVIKPTGGAGTADYGFALVGADYITIDGIDVSINSGSAVEYGFLIKNVNPVNGAQNNIIKNSNISLNKTNPSSIGILQSSSALSSAGYANIPVLPSGTNHDNKYYNITIQNVYNGIYLLSGSSALPEERNEVGVADNGVTIIGAGGANNIGNGTQASWGIRTFAQSKLKIFNCEIKNVTCTGVNSVDGVFVDNNTSSSVTTDSTQIFNNNIHNLINTSSGTTSHRVYGIRVNNSSNISSITRVYNNFIYALNNSSSNTNSRQVIGISAQESGNGTGAVHNILFNSVRLSPSNLLCQNTCLEIGTASGPVMEIQNNVFANFTSSQTGNAKHFCIVTPAGNYPGNTGSISDHNDLYIAAAGNGFTGLTGSTSRITPANWTNAFTPNQDVNSFSHDPGFVSPTDLHIAAGFNSRLESRSINGTGVEFDFENDIRPGPVGSINGGGSFPDIGADEFDGIPEDNSPPSIVYTLLQNSSSTNERNFPDVNISDPAGVDTAAVNLPRVYYKRINDQNTFIDNTNNSGGWKYKEANNNSSPFDFTIDYTLLSGGVEFGNVIQYFVVAQDLAAPSTGINSGTFASAPANVDLTSSAFPISGTINSYMIINVPLAGDYIISSGMMNNMSGLDITFKSEMTKRRMEYTETDNKKSKNRSRSRNELLPKKKTLEVDEVTRVPMINGKQYNGPLYIKKNENPQFSFDATSGVYSTITAAIEDLNLRGSTSDVRFLLADSLYENETLPIIINPADISPDNYTLTIKPDAGVTSRVNGSSSSAVFILNGADHVTIDGSNGSIPNSVCPESTASRDLTIINNNQSLSSAVIWIQSSSNNGSVSNKIMNCIIEGKNNASTLFGIGSGSSTISVNSFGVNNDSNVYENNEISKTQYGIFTQGSGTVNKNNGTVISQNLMNKPSPDNIQFCGIQAGFENDIKISANKIENLLSEGTLSAIAVGLSATDIIISSTTGNEVTNAVIENNIIDNIISTDTLGFSAIGISVAYAASGSATLANNMISGLNAFSSSPDFVSGIFSGGGVASLKLYFNSVSLTGTRGSATFPSFALALGGTQQSTDIQNNIFVNSQVSSDSGKSYAVGLAYSGVQGNYNNLISDNNNLFTSESSGQFSKAGGLQQNIGYNLTSLEAWQSETGRDNSSKNIQPEFTSPYLHILDTDPVNIANLANAGFTFSVEKDIDCDLRFNSSSDIGADEFNIMENSPPEISYTILSNSNFISNRNLTGVVITDSNGIDTMPGSRPRIYFKKAGDGNTFADWKFTEANNNSSPFEFTIDYSLLTGIASGDSIQYFVIAQDLASEPAVNINSGSFASNPTDVSLTSAAFPIGGVINSYKINDAPSIAYSALPITNSLSNRTLAGVVISDPDGIDTLSGKPRIYFKKINDGNTYEDWKFTDANNNSSPFEFTIDYTLLSNVNSGDSIQYFIIAQDLASEPAVSINSGTFALNPTSVDLTEAVFPIGGVINSYKINDAPTIAYTALSITNSLTNRILTGVMISDPDGIDLSGKPRIYFKKTSGDNTLAEWKFTEANNNSSPFEFTIDYSLLTGVTSGDSIQYFIIAQDLATEPAISINSGTFASNQTGVNLNSAAFPIGDVINSYKINDAPSIAYSALPITNSLSNRTLAGVVISDPDGIDTLSGKPRVYFKKTSDDNTLAEWKFSEATNNSSPFEFTIDYTLLSNVTLGDSIQYFIIAQDLANEPAVSINSGSFTSNPTSIILTEAAFPIGGVINSYEILDTTIYNDVSVAGFAVDEWFESDSSDNTLPFSNFVHAPEILLKNTGSRDQPVPFSITYKISGVKSYTSVRTDTIGAGITKEVTFDSTFIADTSGVCSVLIYTSLVNDQDRSNDTLHSSFIIIQNDNYGNSDGYYFANSTAEASLSPSQPQFCWKDTTGSISLVNKTVNVHPDIFTGTLDDGYWKIIIPGGNKIKFFGTDFDTIRIGTNGIISFSEFDPTYQNFKSPTEEIPGGNITNAFYPLWWDQNCGVLNPAVSSNRISYKISGKQLIITFDKASGNSGLHGDFISYQVCMDISQSPVDDSRLLVQFADTADQRTGNLFISNYISRSGQAQLTGLQNAGGTSGHQYRYFNSSQDLISSGPLFDSLYKNLALVFGPNENKLNSSCKSLELAFRLEAIQLNRRDTVTVTLRMPAVPYNIVDVSKAVYDSLTGTADIPFTFADNGSSYFIVVSHRNSIPTWSAGPVVCSENMLSYDFTTGLFKAFENNMTIIEDHASIYCGDIDSLRNAFIDASDILKVYNDNINFLIDPYAISDLDYNGIVDFTDLLFVYNNSLQFIRERHPPGVVDP